MIETIEMVEIPGGSFVMGSPSGELERFDCEGPQHSVTVSQFFMAKYPVTQAQWRAVATTPSVNRILNPDPAGFKGDNRPVEYVSWNDAVEFCDRLAQQTGKPYRLPSEAEWEYACRAGTTTPFHFGDTLSTELANYNGSGAKGEYRKETTPVDYFKIANAFGLYDMHGNVYEWCQDHWHENYEGAPTDGSAWENDDGFGRRTVRGGSWFDFPRYCRSAYRFSSTPGDRSDYVGFRVVCTSLK
jgi:formylglycine-generating enzyme required for sulfatase activity